MVSKSAAHVISPFKFIVIIMSIMLLISICYQRDEFVYKALRIDYSNSSSEYKSSDKEFMAWLGLFIAFNVIEEILVLFGFNIFLDEANLVQCTIHSVGVIAIAAFILNSWSYKSLWYLWIPFGIIPLGIEIWMWFYSRAQFKR